MVPPDGHEPPRGGELSRPLLLFDGDCGFCRTWVKRWHALARGRVDVAPAQDEGARFPHVEPEAYDRSVVLVEPDGTTTYGGEAVVRMLELGGTSAPAWCYRHVPGAKAAAERAYQFIALRRMMFSRATRLLWGPGGPGASYRIASFLFVRSLGLVFLLAFLSLWTQVGGLVGSQGLLPVAPWLDALRDQYGSRAVHALPTLLWIDASDATLHALCAAGTALSVLLVLGIAPAILLALLWAVYLSLAIGGQDFLGFQWDALLLEASLVAIFLAPLTIRARASTWPEPRRLARWMMWWLLFRLMFLSGVVKLASGDATWRDLTALEFHHWTQPLPTPLGWLAAQAPAPVHAASVAVMFVIELGLPLLIWLPRRPRLLACCGFIALQLGIAASGNYGFFNVLSILLALLLVDDACFPRRVRDRFDGPQASQSARWPGWLTAAVALIVLVETTVTGLERVRVPVDWPRPIAALHATLDPLRSLNGYGLFEVMTTRRIEIVLEGSADGVEWRAYEFRWKPGDPSRLPPIVAPHMPRLDWQMWFAALRPWRHPGNAFLHRLCQRLLEGSPEALSLLATNPFPDAPPRHLRTLAYEYRFTTWSERAETGEWWHRELLGAYGPELTLANP